MNPKYKELRGKSYTKELGCLAQGMPGVSKGTKTIVIIRCKYIPHNCKRNVTYTRVCVNYPLEKRTPTTYESLWAAMSSTTLVTAAHLPLT